MIESCLVRKEKFNGRLKSTWEGDLLLSPNPDWLVVYHDPERHRKFNRAGERTRADRPFIHCFSLVDPITVLLGYEENGRFAQAKCDAALPASQNGSEIKFVDLDLDIMVMPDGKLWLEDEAVFAQHQHEIAYPEAVVQQAWHGIDLAKKLVATKTFPFDGHHYLLTHFLAYQDN
ncbi:MAG: DUF402 domain-containing protein [Chloroflexota bacterium]